MTNFREEKNVGMLVPTAENWAVVQDTACKQQPVR